MKKNLLFIFMFLCLGFAGKAQDKIITIQGDTIDCKIKKTTKTTIYFDRFTQNVRMSGELPLSKVSSYAIEHRVTTSPQTKKTHLEEYSHFRFGLGGGLGYLYVSSKQAEEQLLSNGFTIDGAHSYYNGLKLGNLGSADLTYLFSPYWGLGLKYKYFNTSSSQKGFIDPHDMNNIYYGKLSENIYVNFTGISYYSQTWIGIQKKFKLNSSLSLGMAWYRNEFSILNSNLLVTGNNFAADTNVGIEYFVRKNLSLGLDLSGFFSTMKKYNITDGTNTSTTNLDADQYDNISRLDLSVGAKIYF